MPKVTILRDDDWMSLYIDGILRAEGHTITPEMTARALGAEVVPYDHRLSTAYTRHLDRFGSAPAAIGEIGSDRHTKPDPDTIILN